MQPIVAIRAAVAAAASPEEVVQTIRRELRLAWITKEENLRLSALGYNSIRPNPDAAYAEADIVLMPKETLMDEDRLGRRSSQRGHGLRA